MKFTLNNITMFVIQMNAKFICRINKNQNDISKNSNKKNQKQKINNKNKFLCDDEIFDRCVENDNRKL